MRRIQKQPLPFLPELARAHQNPPQTGQDATSRWRNFRDKTDVQDSLLDEQYHLCCYSELRADEVGFGYHIEHVENKSQNPQRTFDYTNLAASSLASTDLGSPNIKGEKAFGGHATGKQGCIDLSLFISCHQSDCARYFSYLSDGRVVPSSQLSQLETSRASYTITLLNLNSPVLQTLRGNWYKELDQLYEEHEAKGWDLQSLAFLDLTPSQGRLSRFFSLTRQFYVDLAARIIQQNAPHCSNF